MIIRLPFRSQAKQSSDPTPKGIQIVRTGIFLLLAGAILGSIIICMLPPQEKPLTEFYILGPERNADLYLISNSINESGDIYIGIHNLENTETLYIVEVFLTAIGADQQISNINPVRRAERYNVTLEHGERSERLFTASFPNTHYNRLDFLLHKSSVPPEALEGTDRINSSYRNLHLWTNTGVF